MTSMNLESPSFRSVDSLAVSTRVDLSLWHGTSLAGWRSFSGEVDSPGCNMVAKSNRRTVSSEEAVSLGQEVSI
jgi:hypothetical protein